MPVQRRINDLDDAIEAAVNLYRSDRSIPKVIVCSLETNRRLITVFGDRDNPTVDRRRSRRP